MNKKAIDVNSEEYYQGWEDGVRECLKLAEETDCTYIVCCLKEWLEDV